MNTKISTAIEVLMNGNRRMTGEYIYTVPSPEHYPFQWLWDSCFHAIILSHFDIKAARAELRSVCARPLANGLLPHMIYWNENYQDIKWGREKEGNVLSQSWGTVGVSSITQPPILATALWHTHTRSADPSFLYELYPVLREYYVSLIKERSFGANGLLGVINPDESGEDNSPRFDGLQSLLVKHTPRENLQQRILRVKEYASCQFDVLDCMRKNFWMEEVSFNAIAIKSFEAMAKIADEIGVRDDSAMFSLCAKQIKISMQLYMREGYLYYSLAGLTRKKVKVETWTLFMPLYAGLLHKEEASLLIENYLLNPRKFATKFPIPSVAVEEPSYTNDDLWRGPTWMAINWFVYKGLKNYDYHDLADNLKANTLALIKKSGFREHYDTKSGLGGGAHNFTWGGLVLDMS